MLASKSSDADQCRPPRETTEKKVSKIGVDLGPEGGVDLAWIFWGREKRPEEIRGDFGTKFVTKFVTKCVTKFVPVSSKNSGSDSCRKMKNPRRAPTRPLRV